MYCTWESIDTDDGRRRRMIHFKSFLLPEMDESYGVSALPSPTSHFMLLNKWCQGSHHFASPAPSLVVDPLALASTVSVNNNPIKASEYSFFCLMRVGAS